MMKRFAMLSLAVIALVGATRASAEDPVKLLFARSGLNGSGSYAFGYVEVQNLAYTKEVTIHYRLGTGDWTDVAATYVAATHDNLEAWQFSTPAVNLGLRQYTTVEFAIKYVVSGSTYWDNNNGSNYKVGIGYDPSVTTYILQQSKVVLDYAQGSSSSGSKIVNGGIWLQNLAYTKVVNVVYSVDNWQTTQSAAASYSSTSSSGIETWNFDLTVPTATTSVVLAVSYTVNGQTYWDNNFGQNYTVSF